MNANELTPEQQVQLISTKRWLRIQKYFNERRKRYGYHVTSGHWLDIYPGRRYAAIESLLGKRYRPEPTSDAIMGALKKKRADPSCEKPYCNACGEEIRMLDHIERVLGLHLRCDYSAYLQGCKSLEDYFHKTQSVCNSSPEGHSANPTQ